MEGRQVVHSTYVLIGGKKKRGIGKYAHYDNANDGYVMHELKSTFDVAQVVVL